MAFKGLVNILPEVEVPKVKPPLKKRLLWTFATLLIFASLTLVEPIGMTRAAQQAGFLQNIQLITASNMGTLATLGIGPIVMASIILQLLNGAGLLQFNRNDPKEREVFQGLQKFVAILFSFFEATVYVISGFIPSIPGFWPMFFLILQLALGGIIVMFLDEVVSKYGIGSGVGLFIAAGVSFRIFWRAFAWVQQSGQFVGLVPQLLQGFLNGNIPESALFPLISTIIVFLIVVYAESTKIEIPLTFGRIRGFGARYPLKFFYVSNIPVIFSAALFANVQLWGIAFQNIGIPIFGTFVGNQPTPGGLAYYLQAPYGLLATPTQIGITLGNVDLILRIIIFSVAMIIMCVVFGKFWVEMSGMGAKQVAQQMQSVGLHVPGFRRDPRVLEQVFNRYIPTLTVVGSASVGILAVLADLTGALGTGTGILLTVGILYRMYEELAAQEAFEMMPALRTILGG
ncbi:preprotein translocase subunit SecY [Candidatus Micrarchaeota archaeon]|nr:MAG: preprotein translocase subunit SecY [Candidatus Micrarchaeota archaeon]